MSCSPDVLRETLIFFFFLFSFSSVASLLFSFTCSSFLCCIVSLLAVLFSFSLIFLSKFVLYSFFFFLLHFLPSITRSIIFLASLFFWFVCCAFFAFLLLSPLYLILCTIPFFFSPATITVFPFLHCQSCFYFFIYFLLYSVLFLCFVTFRFPVPSFFLFSSLAKTFSLRLSSFPSLSSFTPHLLHS